MYEHVYSQPDLMMDLMSQIASVKRYIDDGAGQFKETTRQFATWIKKVNDRIAPMGFEIDEYDVKNAGCFVSFLDNKFTFDALGKLQTDLPIKETDARSYLQISAEATRTTSSQV